jgi:hypothetical protein
MLRVAAFLGFVCGPVQAQPQQPNILVIMGDDIANRDIISVTLVDN